MGRPPGDHVYQALGTNAITHYAAPGQSNPAHCTASGKLLLAFASENEIDEILSAPLARFTENTRTSPAVLQRELRQIRLEARAINHGEFASDVGAVAALVRDGEGQALAALTITLPNYQFAVERQTELLTMVEATAREISDQLGYRPSQSLGPIAVRHYPARVAAPSSSRVRRGQRRDGAQQVLNC